MIVAIELLEVQSYLSALHLADSVLAKMNEEKFLMRNTSIGIAISELL